MKRFFLLFICVSFFFFSYSALAKEPGVEKEPSTSSVMRVELYPSSAKVRVGQSCIFSATGYNRNDQPVPFSPSWYVTDGSTMGKSGMFQAGSGR